MCLTLILWKPLISRDAATVELELPEVAMGRGRAPRDGRTTERRTELLHGIPLPAAKRVIARVIDGGQATP